jgi:hypothetical protein
MPTLSRTYGAVFTTSKAVASRSNPYHVRGVPVLELNILPTVTNGAATTNGTLVVYLLGVNPILNEGHLFSYSPWTFKCVSTSTPTTLIIPITVSLYDVPDNYHLAVVVAAQDEPLFLDQNAEGTKIQLLGGSKLTVPIETL